MSQWNDQPDVKEEKTIKKQVKKLSEVFQSAEENVKENKRRSLINTVSWS
jgi:hypothetical protein